MINATLAAELHRPFTEHTLCEAYRVFLGAFAAEEPAGLGEDGEARVAGRAPS